LAKTRTYTFKLRTLPQRQFASGEGAGNPVPRGAKPDVPTKIGDFSYRDYMNQIVFYAQGRDGMNSGDLRTAGKILDVLEDAEDGDSITLPADQWRWFCDHLKRKTYGAAVKESGESGA
jgi:hypothetical protein